MKINDRIGKHHHNPFNVLYIDRVEDNTYSMATPNIRTTALWVMKFTILVDLLGHHYLILSLSDLFLDVKKKILKEIMYFHYMTCLVTP